MESGGLLSHSQEPAIFSDPVHAASIPFLKRPNLILSCHLHLSLASCLFPTGFLPTKSLSPIRHICHMPHPSHSSWFDHSNNIWCKVQITKLIMQYSPIPCYLFPLSPKHLPQRPILRHPQYMLLPQCERPDLECKKNFKSISRYIWNSCGTSKGKR